MADVAKVTNKWKTRLGGAGDAYKDGIAATKVNPMERAAQQKDKYLRKTQEAVSSGLYEKRLMDVPKSDWQSAAINKGAGRLISGATDGAPKYERFARQFLPFAEQVSEQIQQMSNVTAEDAEQRMLTNVRRMREFKMQRGR